MTRLIDADLTPTVRPFSRGEEGRMSSLDLCCPGCQGWAAEEYEPRIAALEAELERAHGIMSICSGPCHGPMGDKYIGEVKDLMAELERVNRIVVSQSQQLGNTRSQREHELIEALDSAQADADIEALEAKLAVAEALAAERTEQRNVALSRLSAAEAEAARLRCCGNCEHLCENNATLWPCSEGGWTKPIDPCHFAPSRWKEAER